MNHYDPKVIEALYLVQTHGNPRLASWLYDRLCSDIIDTTNRDTNPNSPYYPSINSDLGGVALTTWDNAIANIRQSYGSIRNFNFVPDKVSKIKKIREWTGLGLKESKDYMDFLAKVV